MLSNWKELLLKEQLLSTDSSLDVSSGVRLSKGQHQYSVLYIPQNIQTASSKKCAKPNLNFKRIRRKNGKQNRFHTKWVMSKKNNDFLSQFESMSTMGLFSMNVLHIYYNNISTYTFRYVYCLWYVSLSCFFVFVLMLLY